VVDNTGWTGILKEMDSHRLNGKLD